MRKVLAKKLKIKEIYFTLQGEGYYTGRSAVFCRFAGCNLWSGREEDRSNAVCKFCDTDFWGTDGENGGIYTEEELTQKIKAVWGSKKGDPFVVFTGGEPALQLTTSLIDKVSEAGFFTSIETNGTIPIPTNIDWVTVSPKSNTDILISKGSELKLVYPQSDNDPQQFINLDFDHFYLQPLDNAAKHANTKLCMEYCRKFPHWKLSLQTHKLLGIK